MAEHSGVDSAVEYDGCVGVASAQVVHREGVDAGRSCGDIQQGAGLHPALGTRVGI